MFTQADIEKDQAITDALIDLMRRFGANTPQAHLDFLAHVAVAALAGVALIAGEEEVRQLGPRVVQTAIESAKLPPVEQMQ